MANFSIKYAVSATPIEELIGTDTDNTRRIIHSSIDKTFGGGGTVLCDTTATNVKYIDYLTTVTDTDSLATAGLVDGIDFLMIKIREAGSTGTPDVQLRIATNNYNISTLSGVGDVILLKTAGWTVANYELFSSDATTLAKLDILYGITP